MHPTLTQRERERETVTPEWVGAQRLQVLGAKHASNPDKFIFSLIPFLIHTLQGSVVDRYGVDVVGTWRWEAWNEPDHVCSSVKRMGVGIDCDEPSWLAYVDS